MSICASSELLSRLFDARVSYGLLNVASVASVASNADSFIELRQ